MSATDLERGSLPNMGGPLRVIGYCRVSTDRQADEGFGLPAQRAAIEAWAAAEGVELVDVVEEAFTGMVDEDRPMLAELLGRIEDGEAGGVVVARGDRLARTLTGQEVIFARVWRAGCRVFSADTGEVLPDDPDDPMRTFVRQVMGAAAQLDRAMTLARLRGGRAAKAAAGGFAYGSPPFGWRADRMGGLEPVEAEQLTIVRLVELRRSGLSMRAIAEVLNGDGVPTQRGGRWGSETVARVLRREAPELAGKPAAKRRGGGRVGS